MSNLTAADKRYLEKILNMGGGYVLDFTNATFAEFFNRYNVDIHGNQFLTYGDSKAKKCARFGNRSLMHLLDVFCPICSITIRWLAN